MAHRSASKLTFTPQWADLSDDEQTAETAKALEIVAEFGGTIRAQYVLVTDAALLSVIEYPDETSAITSALAIARRGAFALESQTALSLDDLASLQDDIRAAAGV